MIVCVSAEAAIAGREARAAARAAALASVPQCLARASLHPLLALWTVAGVSGALRGIGGHVLGVFFQ